MSFRIAWRMGLGIFFTVAGTLFFYSGDSVTGCLLLACGATLTSMGLEIVVGE